MSARKKPAALPEPPQVQRQAPAEGDAAAATTPFFLLARRVFALGAALGLFGAAVLILHAGMSHVRRHGFAHAIDAIPPEAILAAIGATIASYSAVSLFDRLGLAFLNKHIGFWRTVPASFGAYAVGNNLGVSFLAGGALRARLYATWGLSAPEIAALSVVSELTTWLGAGALIAAACLIEPTMFGALLRLPPLAVATIGLTLFLALGGFFLAAATPGFQLKIGHLVLDVPRPRLLALQTGLGAIDWSASALVLYVLLPPHTLDFAMLIPLYVGAHFLGVLSGVPGGLAVFEAAMLLVLPGGMHVAAAIVAALFVHRLLYYVLPLLASGALLAAGEIALARPGSTATPRRISEAIHSAAPLVFGLLAFFAGTVLIASGATPALRERLAVLDRYVPLFVVELSHFIASIVGLVVLVVAWGLVRRIDRAFFTAIMLLGGGIVLSLLKGVDYEQALALTVILILLVPCRAAFNRHSGLAVMRLPAGWLAAILGSVIASVWLGLFSYRHVDYAHELWWQFLLTGNASRFLRAEAGVCVGLILIAAWQAVRPARPPAPEADAQALARAVAVIERADMGHPEMWMSQLGDKHLLFSESGKSFIMYGVRGASFVALGEPVGQACERRALLWRFRELCDEYEAQPAFYAVRANALPELAELGLTFQKIGESAIVDLAAFGLTGSTRTGLRYTFRKLRREGAQFEVVSGTTVDAIIPDLHRISDEWLAMHKSREKSFSLGRFDPAYLSKARLALVRVNGTIVAFANLLTCARNEMLTVDLMRYGHDAPRSVMEYLFIEAMHWGQERGYKYFDLGMAPLAGLDNQRHAPLGTRIGAFVYAHGGAFYGFEGLRRFKDKFDPKWEPLYLAAPSQLFIPILLGRVALLTSGGLMGFFGRRA
jgi:phosphatidylglycerol lysyltransferase